MRRILFFSLLLSFVISSCSFFDGKRVSGNGNRKTESRTVSAFNSVRVSGDMTVYLRQDSSSSVKIEADENLMEYIEVSNDGNTLHIKPKDNYNLRSSQGIKIYVSNATFEKLGASGACTYVTEAPITVQNDVNFDLSGSCDIHAEISAPKIDVDASGSGSIALKGTAKDFEVDGSGSTDVKCFNLVTENTKVKISGSGSAEVYASSKLDVDISGSADVQYKGAAAVSQSISGAGSVKKVD